jgi:AraC-like DNA-binding protein
MEPATSRSKPVSATPALTEITLQQRIALIANEALDALRNAIVEAVHEEELRHQARTAPADELLSAVLGLRTPIHPNAVYSYAEAARVTGMSERTLRRWVERTGAKRLKVHTRGAVVYFMGQDLLDWLKAE